MEGLLELILKLVRIRLLQSKPSIANQGQAMDGYAALANYNAIVDEIITHLEKERKD